MTHNCPQCGAPRPEFANVVADDATGVISIGKRQLQLTRKDYLLVRCLLNKGGSVVSRAEIQSFIWPGLVVIPNTLDSKLGRVRRKLQPLGLQIISHKGFGYKIAHAKSAAITSNSVDRGGADAALA